jgi:hypothetical protein
MNVVQLASLIVRQAPPEIRIMELSKPKKLKAQPGCVCVLSSLTSMSLDSLLLNLIIFIWCLQF